MKKFVFLAILLVVGVACFFGCSPRTVNTNYTVIFDNRDGSIFETDLKEIAEPTEPTREGSVFEGWYENADCLGKAVEFPYFPTKDITLYAKYIDFADGNAESKYGFTDHNVFSLISYSGQSRNLVIPDVFDGKPVEKISLGSIKNGDKIKKVYFGGNLEFIEETFYNFPSFEGFVTYEDNDFFVAEEGILYGTNKSSLLCYPRGKRTPNGVVNMPDSLKTVKKNSLRNASVTVLNLGSNIEEIEEKFSYVDNLTAINVTGKNYRSEGGVLFDKDRKTLIAYPAERGSSYTLPPLTEKVAEGAFDNSNLEALRINDALEEFGVQEMVLELKYITVSENNTCFYAKDGVLFSFDGILMLYPPSRKAEEYSVSATAVGKSAFAYCRYLKKVVLSSQINRIYQFAFARSNIEEISFEPNSTLERIDATAFYFCGELTALRLTALVPPEFPSDEVSFTITVPAESLEAYQAAWRSNISRLVGE